MDPHTDALMEALRECKEPFTESIVRSGRVPAEGAPGPEYGTDALVQMAQGFLSLLEEEIEGRTPAQVRTFFLDVVMPELRDSGLALSEMMRGSAAALTSLVANIVLRLPEGERSEALTRLSKFVGDYLHDITEIWAQGRS